MVGWVLLSTKSTYDNIFSLMTTIGVLMSTKAPTHDNNFLTRVNIQATIDNTKPQASSKSEPQPEVIFLYKKRVILRNPLFKPKEKR